jgi:predicted dehydrogenase/aryl-alcohol dehydrogenase-like predicted oxidoreductase
MTTLNWGVISTGSIARTFARALTKSKTGKLIAVGSRSQENADKFGREFGVTRCYSTYDALLADPDVQAVYIAPPHPMHAEWAIKAAEAGKHILCEKPIGMNHAEAMAIIEAARENDVFLMEAFMYRCHPQTHKLVELLRQKVIGEIRVIHASFSFHANLPPHARHRANELGGGGILDVGCYCTSMARLVAGVAIGKDFVEPLEVKGVAQLGSGTGTDEWAIASVKFPNNILAHLSCGVQVNQENVVKIYGSEGSILVHTPWIPAREGGLTKITVSRLSEKAPQEILIKTDEWLYAIEADTVAANIAHRQAEFPAMTWDDTLGNMKTLDRWRDSIGLYYEQEKPQNVTTVHKRPLQQGRTSFQLVPPEKRTTKMVVPPSMPYGKVAGVTKPISRLVMGTMIASNPRAMPYVAVMFDDFFERGGNCYDTAHIYASGTCEKMLGQWMKNRGIREQVVILGKGAHTPWCNPADLTKQLLESLERLQTDYLDIYMMHRDNLEIPVGEFIDVLNEHKNAGRIRAFGGSNWSLGRVDDANAYAKKTGKTGFAAISNNLSLARSVLPQWDGCLSSSDPQSRAWFKQTQTPLFAWSSQAAGFFARGNADDRSDKVLVDCWYADDNFTRKQRAEELAAKRGVTPTAIAAAYVLNQPFPCFPLIGPQTLRETHTSLQALDIKLSPDELAWLNLEK